MTTTNPWQVDSIQAFSFLKCPECIFDTKEEELFQDHAIENHPLSFVLFGKELKQEQFDEFQFDELEPPSVHIREISEKTPNRRWRYYYKAPKSYEKE